MTASVDSVIAALDALSSAEDNDELSRLDAALTQLAEVSDPERATAALLRVFERFPEDDGFGAFWSVLHALEKLSGYEAALLASVQRRPSEFTIIMLNRILNAGEPEIQGVSILALLGAVSRDHGVPETVRERARDFVIHQTGEAPQENGAA